MVNKSKNIRLLEHTHRILDGLEEEFDIKTSTFLIKATESLIPEFYRDEKIEIEVLKRSNEELDNDINELENLLKHKREKRKLNNIKIKELESKINKTPIVYKYTENEIKEIIKYLHKENKLNRDHDKKIGKTGGKSLHQLAKSMSKSKHVDFYIVWNIVELIIDNKITVEEVLKKPIHKIDGIDPNLLKSIFH